MELLEMSIVANVAVLTPEGIPHISPVWVILQDGKLYFSTKIGSDKYRYLQKHDKVGLNILHPKGSRYCSIHGTTEIRTRDEYNQYNDVVERIIRKYVHDPEKATEFIEKLKQDDGRVLVEIHLLDVFPKKDQ